MVGGLIEKVVSFLKFESDDGDFVESEEISEPSEKIVQMGRKARHHRFEISMISPSSFEDAIRLANCLRGGTAVVCNLSKLDVEIAKRIVDFVSGNAYALGGKTKKVGENIFVFTPAGIRLSVDEGGETGADGGFIFNER
ncbi:MAG: cell division protein SepF [bacterium]